MRRRVRTREARGARETQEPVVSFCLFLTLTALVTLAPLVPRDFPPKMESATSTGLGQNQAEDFAPFTNNKLSYFFAAVKAVAAENERGKLDAEKKAKEEAKK